jgi:hypothetical protein
MADQPIGIEQNDRRRKQIEAGEGGLRKMTAAKTVREFSLRAG